MPVNQRIWRKRHANLLDFFDAHVDSIPGWFARSDAEALAAIDFIQKSRFNNGNLLELGVWEGRSLFFLAELLAKSERLFGVDQFVAPGRTEGVKKRLADCRARKQLHLVRSDTKQFKHFDGLPRRSCRLVHVDADHEHSSVLTDLHVAMEFLQPEGAILVLDDLPHRNWPGVWSAMAEWVLTTPGHDYRPFLITGSKGYLARKNELPFWRQSVREVFPEHRFADREVFDSVAMVLNGPDGPPVMPHSI